ncbi:MAG TPA: RNA polymerase sigma factor [Planctomycetota bacterium]|nr:RNA polymerase sigma factor [Planctomycetota bacterium]
MTNPSRFELVQRASRGDGDAFGTLVAPILGRLLARIRRCQPAATTAADAEDLLQVALSRAFRLLPRYRDLGPESFYRWLTTIARHTAGDQRKFERARRRMGTWFGCGSSALADVRDPATSIPRALMHQEQCARLLDALAAVPSTQRRVVELHVLEAQSLSEIAAQLGLTKNAVWERLHRGLTELRRRLEVASAS